MNFDKGTYYTLDRHGNVVDFEWLGEDECEERKNWLPLMASMRGVYRTKEQAEIAAEQSKPMWVSTGTGGLGYWI